MKIKHIEIEGAAGLVAIDRKSGSTTIRIDTILSNPNGEPAWDTWNVPARMSDAELFMVAKSIHLRTEGSPGTNSDIHDYFRELQRFVD